jgi:ATP-dependent helicase HepA
VKSGIGMPNFAKGNLVRWQNGPSGNIGVVKDVSPRHITVLFDHGEQQTFVLPNDVLTRVTFDPGTLVQIQPGGERGVVIGHDEVSNLLLYRINLASGSQPNVVETSLRPAILTNPLELLRQGKLHSARSVNLRLTATRLLFEHQYGELPSLSNSRVEIKPHQVGVLHRIVSSYPHRFLLADEVGLGKTIEAGLVIKELKTRGMANRVLILAPSGIISQWQVEMRTKFGLIFSLYRGDTVAYLQANHPIENVWTLNDNVIASHTFASLHEEKQREISLAGWDLIVIDEAHHARRTWQGTDKYTTTNLYRLTEKLAEPEAGKSTGVLLLTATPMQLHRFELFSLIELLDLALFADFDNFEDHCESLAGLNQTCENVKRIHKLSDRDRQSTIQEVRNWLKKEPRDIASLVGTAEGCSRLTDELYQEHRLSEVMIRNRKAVVGGFMPRVAQIWPVKMTDAERKAYDATTSYVQSGYALSRNLRNNALGFLMATFQKINSSSSYALRQSLFRRIEKLKAMLPVQKYNLDIEEEDIEEKPVAETLKDILGTPGSVDILREIDELARIVKLIDDIDIDSKASTLISGLNSEILQEDKNIKVIIFTQFRDTQEYLRQKISAPWTVHVYHGQLNPGEKDETVRRFRESKGPQVMISTEAGGEGRNFQFCHIIINYDLPWNPMKIEQRIGRLDRLGQKHPVKVINFSLLGTIEERVLDVLHRRIQVFEQTIGGLDPILGDVEDSIKKIFLLAESEEKRNRALAKLDKELEKRIYEARRAESRLGDLIMDTKSFRQDEVQELLERRGVLNYEAMTRFILGLLNEFGVKIEQSRQMEGVYALQLNNKFFSEFPQFEREGKERQVTFDPSVARDYETIDFLAFGHDLVDKLVEYVRSNKYPGLASYRRISTDEQEPVRGWYFAYVLEYHAVKDYKEVFPVFITLEGVENCSLSAWLLERSARIKREDWSSEELPPRDEKFEKAVLYADKRAMQRLLEQQSALSLQNAERLEKERTKLENLYDYRQKALADKLESVNRVLNRVLESTDPTVRRIIPAWQKNLENVIQLTERIKVERESRLNELRGREQISAQHEMISASFIDIVPATHISSGDA